MKKVICILLIITILFSLAACMQESTENPVTLDSVDVSLNTETETEVSDNLPEFNFDGKDFTLLISIEEFWGDSVHITEMTGDSLDDARYTTVLNTEERFNVKITEIIKPFDTVNNTMRKLIAAGDDSYDWIFLRDSFADTFVQNNLLVEYSELPYVDLTQVYWDQKLLAASTINHRCYYTFGAFDTTYIDRTHCMVFNKQMVENYSITDPYAMVKNGSWTIDAMAATMKNVTVDLNGDGIINIDDQWGYLSSAKQVPVNFWTAAGEQTVKKTRMTFYTSD
jgi:predicted small lipoprotein YifL